MERVSAVTHDQIQRAKGAVETFSKQTVGRARVAYETATASLQEAKAKAAAVRDEKIQELAAVRDAGLQQLHTVADEKLQQIASVRDARLKQFQAVKAEKLDQFNAKKSAVYAACVKRTAALLQLLLTVAFAVAATARLPAVAAWAMKFPAVAAIVARVEDIVAAAPASFVVVQAASLEQRFLNGAVTTFIREVLAILEPKEE